MISVLIVDDESSLLEISTLYLERTGQFSIETALSAQEALGKVRGRAFDAIVSDYQMPGMDGIQFLKELRSSGDKTPFIIFTGKGREDVVIQAFNEGANFYLQKGGEPRSQFTELSHKIRQAVELRREEQARRASEENYRLLFENATEGILIALGDRLVFVNPMLVAILGYPREELTSRPFTDFIHPDDQQMVLDRHVRRMKGEEVPTGYPFRIVRADGTERWVEINSTRILWSGKPASLSFIIDVTGRVQMEEALHRSEEKYREIFEKAPVGLYQVAPGGGFISANTAAARILGYESAGELLSTVTDITTQVYAFPEDRKRAHRIIQETGVLKDFEVQCRHKNGSIVWVLFNASPVRDTSGQVLYHEGTSQDITARKQAEEALQRSQKELELTLDATTEGIWKWDFRTGTVEFSHRYYQMLGYEPGEFPASYDSWLELLHPDDREQVLAVAEAYFAEEPDLYENEFRLRTKSGGYRWVHASARVVERDASGTALRMIGNHQDITERKEALEALRQSEEKYRDIFENALVGFFQTAPDGKLISANRAYAHMYGYNSPEEIVGAITDVGRQMYAIPEERASIIRELKETGFLAPREALVRHKDGHIFWVLVMARSVFDATGGLCCFEGSNIDITARKEAEEALRRNEALYRSVLNASPDDITITDMDGTVTMASPAALAMFRFTGMDEVIGRPVTSFLVSEDRARAAASIAEMNAGIFTGPGQYQGIRADGTVFDIEVNGEFVRDADGKPVSMVFVIRDITGRKRVEQELSESEERFRHISDLISDFAYSCRKVPGGTYIIDWISGAMEKITGYTPEEVLTFTCWRPLVLEADLPLFDRDVGGLMPGQSARSEMRLSRKDGSTIWLACYTECVRDPADPAIHRLYGACRDISRRKEAEARVRLHITRAGALLDLYRMKDEPGSDLYSYTMEASQKVTESRFSFIGMVSGDEAVMTIHAWSRDAMEACAIEDKPMQFPVASAGIWGDCVRTREPVVVNDYATFQAKRGTPEGHVPIIRFLGVPIFDSARIVAVLAVANKAQDYSEDDIGALATLGNTMWELIHRRKADEALVRANKKLNLLGSATRHDISNQMMIVNGYLGLLHEQVTDPALSPYFDRISHAATRIDALIRFSKAYEQIGSEAALWQDCREIAGSAIIEASVGHIKVVNEVPAGIKVYADPLISRVFYNLIDNAVRYGERLTTIRFSGREEGGSYVITCEDDGVGIAPGEKEKIFERGYGKNTGLGLFLAREILAITGITIAETGELGAGARFLITVPPGAWRSTTGAA